MKQKLYAIPVLILCFLFAFGSVQAQESKYKAIQGLGYLHTQITILVENWATHPLSEGSLDAFDKEYRQHFIEEIAHDEEWVEFMLVEDNLIFQFEEHIDADVEQAIEANIRFYDKVIDGIKDPETMDAVIPDLKAELEEADSRLYDIIYPALCK